MKSNINHDVIYIPKDFYEICELCPEIIDQASFPDNIRLIKDRYTSGEMAKITLHAAGINGDCVGRLKANGFTSNTLRYLQTMKHPGDTQLAWRTDEHKGRPITLWPADCFAKLLSNPRYIALARQRMANYSEIMAARAEWMATHVQTGGDSHDI